MKRTWIWGVCLAACTGGAIAIAQQEPGGLTSPSDSPVRASNGGAAGTQEGPAASFSSTNTTGQNPLSSTLPGARAGAASVSDSAFGAQTTRAASSNSDPFGGPNTAAQSGPATAFGGTARSANSSAGPNTRSYSGTTGGFGGGQFGGQVTDASGFTFNGRAAQVMTKEQQAFRAAEQKVAQLSNAARRLGPEHPESVKANEELKAAVTASFEARQVMQQAEVKRLKEKLAEIESHVARREKIKEELIAERLYELKQGGGQPQGELLDSPVFRSMNSFPATDTNLLESTTTETLPLRSRDASSAASSGIQSDTLATPAKPN